MSNKGKTENKWIKNNIQLLIVIVFSILVTVSLIYINNSSNILGHSYRDVYFYLIQALNFSGNPINGYDYIYYLSPLVPYITSILFRFGFVSELSIFIVTGIFYTMATIGMYYLLKLRFNKNISCFGAILYGSISINLIWAANGTLDIPSISFSIWSLYFFILAMEKDQKYFYIAFPLAVLSFLGKYTGALIIAILILYFLSKRDIFGNIKRYSKHLIGGIITGIVFLVPFINYYITNNIPFGFLNQAEEISSTTTTSATAISGQVENQLFYYFENLPSIIEFRVRIIGYLIIILGIIGLIYGTYKFASYLKEYYEKSDKKINLSFLEKIKIRKEIYFIVLILSLLSMILAFFTAGKISFVESEIIFFASALLFSIAFNSIFIDLSKLNIFTNRNKELDKQNRYKYKFFNYDLAMLAWFMGYLIFFSAHLTKAERYFTAFAPGFVFFISYSLDMIVNKLDENIGKTINIKEKSNPKSNLSLNNIKRKIPKIIPIIFIIILLLGTMHFLTMDKHDPLVDNEKDASLWIKENVPNYNNTSIWADRGPIYAWYLQTSVNYRNEDVNMSEIGEYLDDKNASYYIATPWNNTVNGFTKVKTFGNVNIYKNNRLVK